MKISKLFHWLYALVMLLPIFAIGVTSLVSTFNMSAKQESEIHYKYETNEVNNENDLVVGNIYHFNVENDSIDSYLTLDSNVTYLLKFVNIDLYDFSDYTFELDDVVPYDVQRNSNLYLILGIGHDKTTFNFYLNDSENYFSCIITESLTDYSFTLKGDFIYDSSLNPRSIFNVTNFISESNFNIIESVETHNVEPQEIFYRAVDKVQQSPLFNWAYDSFLVAPFAYIVNLFSMPTNSFVVMLLSYWLAISIIWLVFDLVMYVPLLVHRWLDKGVLE